MEMHLLREVKAVLSQRTGYFRMDKMILKDNLNGYEE